MVGGGERVAEQREYEHEEEDGGGEKTNGGAVKEMPLPRVPLRC